MKRNLLIALAVIAAVSLTGCKAGANKKAASQEEQDQSVGVKVEEARIETIAQTVSFTANLQAYKQTFIVPALSARIEKINVEVGDHVRQGQLLVELDMNQYNQAAYQLSNAEANLRRMQSVYEAGGISKQQIDELETSISVMRESTTNLQKNLELRSPINGIVTGRYNEVGDLFAMSPNAAGGIGILQVMQIDQLKAYVNISEMYFTQVHMNMPVTIDTDVLPGNTFTGKVTRIAPAISTATRTFEVEVTIPNRAEDLRPGMYARTTFEMGEVEGVTASDMAVQRLIGTNDKYVFVLNGNTVERRMVTTGRQKDDRIEIISGLSAGDRVVIAGAARLMNGTQVKILN